MNQTVKRISKGVQRRWLQAENNRRILRLAMEIERHAPASDGRPAVFFNASSRLAWMSQNAAFSLIAAWSLRLAGVPVTHFVCQAGMSRCQLGTNRNDPYEPPPCAACIGQSKHLYANSDISWFKYQPDAQLEQSILGLQQSELMAFEWQGLPLGELVLPSLRWALRRHHLLENAGTLYLLRQYILSAWSVAVEFKRFLDEKQPQGVVVFNGISFPEAVARQLALQRGLWVVTHEVGLQPFTAYFTHGQATAYPIDIPADFQLSDAQNERLNGYLQERMKGNFTMAGIRFWPEMAGLSPAFLQKAAGFKQIVPVFTNVIFDTSQIHANVIFPQMFAWLDEVAQIIRVHPETLFVIRAHPDEERPGKTAEESVAGWVAQNRILDLPNVVFVNSSEYLSSYALIQRSKFVLVYNSTIGLEASILGAPVLCGGKARFTQIPTVFLPSSPADFHRLAEQFLERDPIDVPPEFQQNARTFLYFQLFKTSLPFETMLEPDLTPGFVRFKANVRWQDFLPGQSESIAALVDGFIHDGAFLLPNGGD
ncbi:MAG: capsular polysaccharide export protein, LipB/KpsS family [Bellilinea sp.]